MSSASGFTVRRANLAHAPDRESLVALLDMYARDPMGGAEPLGEDTRARLCDDLLRHPKAVSFLAYADDGTAIGLINCFEGYSTFKARPLLNIHDVAVAPAWRARGVGQALLAAAQDEARARGCCKLTLEVLSGNERATRSYLRFGFENYQLDPAAGHALLMQKWL
ncbi:MAG: GNAT family N-acetyltransferase [Betaproteobacteria bacterium]|jgi:GNAT superfamily N-acetyltransferase|nr:GNAT family N-acetyltransferase [Betaproteobacteria bacterium]NBS45941.1 GNAT family N-acetyltransferase [Betaproteobacteria bacterium]